MQTVTADPAPAAVKGRGAHAAPPRDPNSRVDILSRALAVLRGVARLAIATPVARFVAIGVVSTLAYALLFLLLAGALGSAAASAVALALTAVGNTAANRRFTFGIRGRDGLARQQAAGFLVFLLALALTNGALGALHALDGHASRLLEVAVLVIATLVATVTRYIGLSSWVFRGRPGSGRPDPVLSLDTQGT